MAGFSDHPERGSDFSPMQVVKSVLSVLASLRVTVALFALSIILVFVGTLAQVSQDISTIVDEYFRNWIAWIPFQVLFPKTWAPDWQNIPGGIWFPGGWAIGVAMTVNLVAAHSVRFKFQVRGARLWAGLGVIALGVLTTWMVIDSGSNKDGFQGEQLVAWPVLWEILKYGVGIVWVGMASSLLKIEPERRMERWTIVGMTVLLGAALAALFLQGDDAKLNDSSMRILWQLIKGTFAAGVLLVGCVLAFKKRAGIVLLHGGVGLIMFNELLVGMKHVETQMPIIEGETINWVHDVNQAELAIVDHSPKDHDAVVVVPFARLQQAAGGDVVRDDKLPIDFRVVTYLVNSGLVDLSPGEDNPATDGVGLEVAVKGAATIAGTDSDGKVNAASAYIEFFKKGTDKSLGTFLMTQTLTTVQDVGTSDKKFEIVLRSKRTYKDYSLHLIDVRGDTYLGTSMARNYSSDVRLVDNSRGIPGREVKIWMNNPLRYAGETFYQQSFQTFQVRENGRFVTKEQTVLQIVRNAGWMIPYVACMIVWVGMMAHFWLILLRFLSRRSTGAVPVPTEIGGEIPSAGKRTNPAAKHLATDGETSRHFSADDSDSHDELEFDDESSQFARLSRYLPILAVVFVVGWLAGKTIPPRAGSDEMDIYAFGKAPVVYKGRVKPIDSLARNSLKMLSNYQTFKDDDEERRPAIQFLLDVIARPDTADGYRVFRIVHPDVLQDLKLVKRKGYLYAFNEFKPRMGRFREMVASARSMSVENIDKPTKVYRQQVLDLHRRVLQYSALRQTHLIPPKDMNTAHDQLIQILLDVNPRLEQVPLAAPVTIGDTHWQPLTKVATPLWIRRFAKARGHKTLKDVAIDLVSVRHSDDTIRVMRTVIAVLETNNPRSKPPMVSMAAWKQHLRERVLEMPRAMVIREVSPTLMSRLRADMNGESLAGESPGNVTALVDIFAAYRDGEAEKFNELVKGYRASLDESEPDQYDAAQVSAESWFNNFEPFFYGMIIYCFAFVLSLCALFGGSRPLNLTAFSLIAVAFAIHTFGLGMRMYLSGRMGVTVTNLYSSAVFIGWACCLLGLILEVVFRLGIGNLVAGITGFLTLLIAQILSIDGDTIAVMQAVLDTNFWLATHVTSITIGYAATFAAWSLGASYVLLGLFTKYLSGNVGKTLNRMTYGTLCFAIFFSFVGTVLGGLWADDSWGRFWGWDPKENGALIIVLWNALVLHARWGGLVKDRGMAVLTVFGGIVTAWSWFGVNELGVGLHAYGFKSGVLLFLGLWIVGNLAVIAAGCIPKDRWASFRKSANGADSQT